MRCLNQWSLSFLTRLKPSKSQNQRAPTFIFLTIHKTSILIHFISQTGSKPARRIVKSPSRIVYWKFKWVSWFGILKMANKRKKRAERKVRYVSRSPPCKFAEKKKVKFQQVQTLRDKTELEMRGRIAPADRCILMRRRETLKLTLKTLNFASSKNSCERGRKSFMLIAGRRTGFEMQKELQTSWEMWASSSRSYAIFAYELFMCAFGKSCCTCWRINRSRGIASRWCFVAEYN